MTLPRRISVPVFVILALMLVMVWVLFAATRPDTSQTTALFPIVSHGKYGYINQTGKVIITPRFEKAKRFSEGLARVKVGRKWGFIDVTGKIVIPPQFDLMIEDEENDNSLDFHEGMAAVSVDHGKQWGFIDKSGKMTIVPRYARVFRFSEGLAEVYNLHRYSPVTRDTPNEPPVVPDLSRYIDKNGKVLGFVTRGGAFSEGLAVMSNNERHRKEGYIDRTGQIRIQPQFSIARSFHEGLACVQTFYDTNEWGYIDTTGKMVIPPGYQSDQHGPGDFSQGLAAIGTLDDTWGFIDKTGRLVIEPKYLVVGRFSDGVAGACVENQSANADEEGPVCGYIDRTGNWVFSSPTRNFVMTDFYEGLALVFGEDFWGYINKKGDYVWRTTERIDPEGLKVCSWNFDYNDEYTKKCQN